MKRNVTTFKKAVSKFINGDVLKYKERYHGIIKDKIFNYIAYEICVWGHRSNYYKWIHIKGMKNIRLEFKKRLKKGIRSIHIKYKEYGYPHMKIALQEEGYFINHKIDIKTLQINQHIGDSSDGYMHVSGLFDLATARCIEQKILLPGVSILTRLVSTVVNAWENLFILPNNIQEDN